MSALTRREAIGTLGAAGLAAVVGCSPRGPEAARVHGPHEQVLSRFGFGPSSKSVADVSKLGEAHWFAEQLRAPVGDDFGIEQQVWRLPISHLSPWELRDWPEKDVHRQMQTAALIRAVHSPWQVRERMVHFWTDHFNIYAGKGLAAYRKPLDERKVVRAHALGSFGDMLRASARSAAMLVYLDQQASDADHPNENYARELLELHTLGVGGGYTQRDVMEVARCFTGWTEERGFLKGKGAAKFDESLHDDQAKNVLGHTIPAGGGVTDGERVLEIVSNHPATGRHLAQKLALACIGERSPKLEAKLEKTFLATKGHIPALMTTLYEDGAWREGRVVQRPFDFVCSALRRTEAESDYGPALQARLADMGQALYQWPMPDGYPVDPESWGGSLLGRWNFAFALCSGSIQGTHVPQAGMVRLAEAATHAPVASTVGERAALWLCSPEAQWR